MEKLGKSFDSLDFVWREIADATSPTIKLASYCPEPYNALSDFDNRATGALMNAARLDFDLVAVGEFLCHINLPYILLH